MKILNLNKFRPRSDITYIIIIIKNYSLWCTPTSVSCQGQRDKETEDMKFKRLTGEIDTILEGD